MEVGGGTASGSTLLNSSSSEKLKKERSWSASVTGRLDCCCGGVRRAGNEFGERGDEEREDEGPAPVKRSMFRKSVMLMGSLKLDDGNE